jgi:hypothetical protein
MGFIDFAENESVRRVSFSSMLSFLIECDSGNCRFFIRTEPKEGDHHSDKKQHSTKEYRSYRERYSYREQYLYKEQNRYRESVRRMAGNPGLGMQNLPEAAAFPGCADPHLSDPYRQWTWHD